MRIVFDNIIFNLQKIGGISIYWSELLKRLILEDANICLMERPNANVVRDRLLIDNVKISTSGSFPIIISRFLDLRLKHIKEKFIFHSSYNRSTSNPHAIKVVTVHDFVHERYYTGMRRLLHSYQKRKAILAADAIIVISENTKRDLLWFFPEIKSKKVQLIYNGVSEDFFPIATPEVSSFSEPYILFIGSREKYKNFNFTVELLSHLKSFSLQIIGSELTSKELVLLNSLIPGRWNHSSYVSNSDLNRFYNNAYALFYPSAYEGFGIPIVEAMKAGCPFVAGNFSSIPEVAGDAGILLDSFDITSAKKAIGDIAIRRAEIIEKGFEQGKKFSWNKCYRETIMLYKELYKG